MKGQAVRVLDVLVLGPFMIWAGVRARDLPVAARVGLVITGGGTVVYNALNLAAVEDRRQRLARK